MPQFAKYPSLEGKTVFVSGGGSGIGADIVTGLAEQGARIGFVDFNAEAGAAMMDTLPPSEWPTPMTGSVALDSRKEINSSA